MKRGLAFGIVFGLILTSLSFIGAASCGPEHRILKLYQDNNSHASLYDFSQYTVDICYNDSLFGFGQYSGEISSVHNCSGKQPILWLYQNNNSHVSTTNVPGYDIPVCYGDLICNARLSCDADEKIIASLYQDNNSHISYGNDSMYLTKICCKKAIIEEIYWADMNGNKIGNDIGIEANLGDTVKMVWKNTGLVEGTSVVFEIYENDILEGIGPADDEIRVGANAITGLVNSDGDAVAKWKITQSDLEKTSDFEEFVFIVQEDENKKSNDLTINRNEINTPPSVQINGPKDRQIYFLDEVLRFDAEVSDPDDEFSYVWHLGDGETREGNSTSEEYNFTYAYSAAGQKNIELRATDERGLVSKDRISILIINSSYVMAYIDDPRFGESYDAVVNFNASGTYAVDSVTNAGGCKIITCLAGNCPSNAAGVPPDYPAECPKPISVSGTPAPYNKLSFNWTFDDGTEKFGQGEDYVRFPKVFINPGIHVTNLKVEYLA